MFEKYLSDYSGHLLIRREAEVEEGDSFEKSLKVVRQGNDNW